MSALRAWERFWFSSVSSDTLALLRIFLAVSSLMRSIGIYGFANRFMQDKLVLGLPLNRFSTKSWRFDDLPVPLVDGAPRHTLDTYQSVELAALILAFLFAIGLGARIVGPLLGLALLSTQLFDQAAFKHHVFTLSVAVVVVGFAPCSDRYSVDSLLNLGRPRERSVLPLRMLQAMVTAIYLFSTIAKLNATWLSGYLFAYTASQNKLPAESFMARFHESDVATVLWLTLSWTTILAETFLVFGFWSRTLRPLAFAVGFWLHFGIEVSLDVGTYSSTMLALYIAFLEPSTRTLLVRYDASSASARRLAFIIRALDWTARYEVVAGAPALSEAARGPRIDLVTRDAVALAAGRDALVVIARRLPLTMPFVIPLITLQRVRRRFQLLSSKTARE